MSKIQAIRAGRRQLRLSILAAGLGFNLLVLGGDALAQARPDAGSIQQEQERGRVPGLVPAPRNAPLVEERGRPALAAPAARVFPVAGFRVTRTTVFPEADLLLLLVRFKGRDLSLADLEYAAEAITLYYRERGYFLARAYVPAQDIRDGIVEITVLEGAVEGIQLKLGQATRLQEGTIRNTVRAAVPGDGPVRLAEIERGMLLLKAIPGIEALAVLLPGAELGTSVIAVEVNEGPLLSGSLDFDNHGSKFTGAFRLGATLEVNNPTGFGDQLSVRATSSAGTTYGRLAYQVPVGVTGLKVGGAYAETRYRLCCDFAPLEARGQAQTASLNAAYPILRGRDANLYGTLAFESRHYLNATLAGTTSDKKARAVMLGLNGDSSDFLGGGGLNSFSLAHASGRLDLDGSVPDRVADDASARSHGGYRRIGYALARLQRLGASTSLYAGLSGQFASRNLDSSEKFILGGPYGVRGFPSGEGAGDEGMLLNLEVRHELRPALQFTAFYDRGEIRLHRNEWAGWQGTNTLISNRYGLSGAGLGVNWGQPGNFFVRASVARPVGDNPGRNANGNNADNTSNHLRLWFQAVKFL